MREQFRQELKDLHAEVVDIRRDGHRQHARRGDVARHGRRRPGREGHRRATTRSTRAASASRSASLETIATQFPVARDLRLLQSLDLHRDAPRAHGRSLGQHRQGRASAPPIARARRRSTTSSRRRATSSTACSTRRCEALENRDLELARKLPELDEPIDHLYKQFFRELGAAARRGRHRVGLVDGAREPLSRADRRQRRRHRRAHRVPDHRRARVVRR